jgi:hypothetical protein
VGPATTAAQKATAVFQALTAKDAHGDPLVPNAGYKGNTTVTAADSKIAVTGDTTAEVTKVADLGSSFSGGAAYASFGFTGPLSAMGTDGSDSTFTASFGVDDSTFASATVDYSQLTAPTDDGLATALYFELLSGLSPSLQGDLSLNLATDSIVFTFPAGSGEYFAQTSTTSPGTSAFLTAAASQAPEPATILSLGAGLILLGAARRRRAKHNS